MSDKFSYKCVEKRTFQCETAEKTSDCNSHVILQEHRLKHLKCGTFEVACHLSTDNLVN